jgi:hypothetical protein
MTGWPSWWLRQRKGPDENDSDSHGQAAAMGKQPRNPMRHAMAPGIVGCIVSLPGAVYVTTHDGIGPACIQSPWWSVKALPCAWLGGVLYRMRPPPR